MKAGSDIEFQFHKGAIRTDSPALAINVIANFNSIKVRLEHSFDVSLIVNDHISIP